MRKKTLCLLLISACALGVSSCKKNPSDSDATPLVVDLAADAPTLDPAMTEDTQGHRVSFDLFDGLISFDQKNNPILSMAKSLTISPNGKVYTFVLKDNLKFSNGDPINADDFIYSWQRVVDSKLGSTYAFIFAGIVNARDITSGKLDKSKLGVKAIDAKTIEITLEAPDSDFLKKMTLSNFYVVNKKVIEKFKDKWTSPGNFVGSGAYTLKDRVINGYILETKNPYYYDESNVQVKTIQFTVNDDVSANYMQYKSGGINILNTLPIDQKIDAKNLYPQDYRSTGYEATQYYSLNMKLPEIKNNPKLRQALSMAVDRVTLAKKVLGGDTTPLYTPFSTTIEAGKFSDIHYSWETLSREQQVAQAQKLYKEAGYSADKPLSIEVSFNNLDKHRKVALAVASMWKDVLGVNVTIANMEWKTFLQNRQGANYQIARDGWVTDYDSALSYATIYLCSNKQNNSKYCDPKYDALVSKALQATDEATKVKLLHQAFILIMNDYPIIPLFQEDYSRLVDSRISGYDLEANHLDHVQSKWYRFTK